MKPFLQNRCEKLRAPLSHRVLDFQPYIGALEIAGCPIRFFYATAQAASWYDPLKEKNRRELEWLVANIDLEGQKIIDAGAYHGLYATIFAKAAGDLGEVVAVDPVSSNQAVIEVNLAINGLRGRIESCVVSNTEGAVAFLGGQLRPHHRSGWHSPTVASPAVDHARGHGRQARHRRRGVRGRAGTDR